MKRLTVVLRLAIVGLTVWFAVRFFDQTTYSVSIYVDIWAPALGVIAAGDLLRRRRVSSSSWYTGGLLVMAALAAVYAAGKDGSSTDSRLPALCVYAVAAALLVASQLVSTRRSSTASTVTVSPSVT